MYLGTNCKKPPGHYARLSITKILAFFFCLLANRSLAQQHFSLSEKNISIEKVFKEIKKQTGYAVVYRDTLLSAKTKVDINVANASLSQVMEICLKNQPLTYSIVNKLIVVVPKKELKKAEAPKPRLTGSIIDKATGKPLEGAIVVSVPTGRTTVTNAVGLFEFADVTGVDKLSVSFTGYNNEEINIGKRTHLDIALSVKVAELDEVVQIAYGTTSKRYNTGSVAKVSAADIEKQPVSNPLAALEGRVPGLIITQTTGVTGGAFKVQIRGQNSILQGSDPLFIIDGVPFTPGNTTLSTLSSAVGNGGISPFSVINPMDIESVEVLKDADATAIYGSRGANGVILITTKKGKVGKTSFSLNAYSGISKVSRTIPLMNTQQYVAMRKEAYKNDNKQPAASTAPDLLVWDTTAYTDFTNMFIGGTAHTNDINASVSGGSGNTKFLIGGTYHYETTVFPGEMADTRGAMHLNFNHTSLNRKFTLDFQANYASDKNNLPPIDLTANTTLSPNAPNQFDSSGNLVWYYKGYSTGGNPLAYLFSPYKSVTDNLISNINLSYLISKNLFAKLNAGYNTVNSAEQSLIPIVAQDPTYNPMELSNFGNTTQKGWILEPQINFKRIKGDHAWDVLVGATIQNINASVSNISAGGYTSDALLTSLAAATTVTGTSANSIYKYAAVFGRINYRFRNTYIINLTGRRDGSSRFGPDNQWANFGAVGGAWIFSNYDWIKQAVAPLSFGKIRVSYGSAGNDQIGNYQYFDTWSSLRYTYQQTSGLIPTRLYNPNYGWEINKKLEVGLELGFLKDRIIFTGAWFRNRSGNQLVQYTLPAQTGFTGILSNLPATVQNTGIELTLNTKNIVAKNFSWASSLAVTVPRNKLIAFPGLASSSYASAYVIGQPLSVIYKAKYTGVDPSSGVYQFEDFNKDGAITSKDYQVLGYTGAKLYGGFSNAFSYKSWQLDIFLEGRQQIGRYYMTSSVPGVAYYNRPVDLASRWQNPGDITNVQQFSTTSGTAAYKGQTTFVNLSDGAYTDASYIRVKNISLAYSFSERWLSKAKINRAQLYLRAQNLFTITGYKGSDPETLAYNQLPTLKTIVGGIQITF